jgi:phospho-N-acetylmuramoyl-pentapeptide-transferase
MTKYAVIVAAIIGFIVSGVLGYILIPILRRLKFGQSINEIGPVWHKNKQGIPTMGGFMFIIGTVLSTIIGFSIAQNILDKQIIAGVAMALAFGTIGFMDDYVKVVRKRNLGLTAGQKSLFQLLIAVAYLVTLYIMGNHRTVLYIPFTDFCPDIGLFYYPFMIFIIVGFVNAVNLTDGIDGLAGSVTLVVGAFFIIAAKLLVYDNVSIVAAALAGSCMGFLIWNFFPAKVIMGDTGSMFLGGMVCALAFSMNMPLLLLPVGIIYIVETLSVILQVISFKTTGKRIFKMSPIHHHFEMSGWQEVKIVAVFTTITIITSIATIIWLVLKYRG